MRDVLAPVPPRSDRLSPDRATRSDRDNFSPFQFQEHRQKRVPANNLRWLPVSAFYQAASRPCETAQYRSAYWRNPAAQLHFSAKQVWLKAPGRPFPDQLQRHRPLRIYSRKDSPFAGRQLRLPQSTSFRRGTSHLVVAESSRLDSHSLATR